MIIKCPQCSTGYNIPDKALGDRPRKMKCAKCQHQFTITRRKNKPPEGYVEFTGAQKLPPEFAFLQASVPPSAKPAPSIPMATTRTTPAPTTPASLAQKPAAPTSSSQTASVAAAPPPPAQAEPAVSIPGGTPMAESPGQIVPPTPGTPNMDSPAAQAAIAELQRSGGTPIGNSLPAETMFGGNSSAWEIEAPMELGNFTVAPTEDEHHGNQALGKIVFGVFVAVVGFLVFVAFRNSWDLSLSELPEQVAFAVSGEAIDEVPESAENIEVTVISKKVISSAHGTYLSVAGEVINNNPGRRSQVIIRGKLYDSKGKIRGEARMPCGRAVDDKAIKKTVIGGIQNHFNDEGTIHNCQIGPNDSKLFQVVFEDVPDDYDAGFEVKVKAIAAVAQ